MTEAKKKTVKPAGKSAPKKSADEKSAKEIGVPKKKAKAVTLPSVPGSDVPTAKTKRVVAKEQDGEKPKTRKKVGGSVPPVVQEEKKPVLSGSTTVEGEPSVQKKPSKFVASRAGLRVHRSVGDDSQILNI
jgi:hypothetical protein